MDPADGFLIELALIGVLIVVNGFFAAAEIAIVTARRARLQALAEQGSRGAQSALRLKADPDRFLATVQIGVTVVGTLASAVGGVAAIERLEPVVASLPFAWARQMAEPVAVGLVVFAIAYLSLVVGELVPKALAVRNAERLAVVLARFVETLQRLSRWAVTALTGSSRLVLRLLGRRDPGYQPFHTLEDLKAIGEEAQEQGVVKGDLITGAVEFHERQLREVLTPRSRIESLPASASLEQALRVVRESGHSRFPVHGSTPDDVLGFVYGREVYEAALDGAPLDLPRRLRPVLVVPVTKAATELLAEMRRTGIPMAIAVDEHGGVTGIVTVEDLVEVIVGEIRDEHVGVRERVRRLANGSVEVDGSVPLHVLHADFGVELPESPDYVTVAGLILHRSGSLPEPGRTMEVPPYRLTVLAVEGRRIAGVRVTRADRAGEAALPT